MVAIVSPLAKPNLKHVTLRHIWRLLLLVVDFAAKLTEIDISMVEKMAQRREQPPCVQGLLPTQRAFHEKIDPDRFG
ncbi:hypothetical protein [Agrobacterium sp. NPDC089420]|uniref:hypothetical protein n=1 Tax=Agrobacterium sp. NPDC089420 TaxID=3363918 RepID=UPI00384FB8D1